MTKGVNIDARVGFTKIAISGFKSIKEEIQIEVKPLTVIAGANSSGKSSAMQLLLILKQTLEAAYDPGVLQISGNNIAFTSVNQIFNAKATPEMKLNLRLVFDGGNSIFVSYGVKASREIYIRDYSFENNTKRHFLKKNNITSTHVQLKKIGHYGPFAEISTKDAKTKLFVKPQRCFLAVSLDLVDPVIGNKNIINIPEPVTSRAAVLLTETIHLPGLRGNPARNYQVTRTTEDRLRSWDAS